jgi:hypothetical protein
MIEKIVHKAKHAAKANVLMHRIWVDLTPVVAPGVGFAFMRKLQKKTADESHISVVIDQRRCWLPGPSLDPE